MKIYFNVSLNLLQGMRRSVAIKIRSSTHNVPMAQYSNSICFNTINIDKTRPWPIPFEAHKFLPTRKHSRCWTWAHGNKNVNVSRQPCKSHPRRTNKLTSRESTVVRGGGLFQQIEWRQIKITDTRVVVCWVLDLRTCARCWFTWPFAASPGNMTRLGLRGGTMRTSTHFLSDA